MARPLRIPFLVDLLRTSDPTEIRSLGGDTRLDRQFESGGPLLNRILVNRLRSVLAVDGVPLPSVAPRGDQQRARNQATLTQKLDAVAAQTVADAATLGELASVVRGEQGTEAIGPAVQQAIGRLFEAGYQATPESWRAAQDLDEAVRTRNPVKSLIWRLTGRIDRAQRLLSQLVGGDRAGVHATGIAIHNLVRGIERMRELWAQGRKGARASSDAVIAHCLVAPASVLRQATARGSTVTGEFRPGTLVTLDLEKAREAQPGADVIFMAGTWAQCPAGAWVSAVLAAVWTKALEAERRGP
jgi:hypothetical protein